MEIVVKQDSSGIVRPIKHLSSEVSNETRSLCQFIGRCLRNEFWAILAEKALKLNPRLVDSYTLLSRVYAMNNE